MINAMSASADSFSGIMPALSPSIESHADVSCAREFYRELRSGRFHLAFQPIVSGQGAARPLYTEALLRGSGGALGFDPFAVLERLQMIRRLDRVVVNRVIELLGQHHSLTVGCNISALSARLDPTWEIILQQLADSPALARRLVIEVTETAAPINHGHTADFIRLFRQVGCHVAIDDFGSGFATFALIQQGEPDVIKIDKGYIQRACHSAQQRKTLKHLIGLCKALAPNVVVEGIETAEAADVARDCGAIWLQGYLFARPSAQLPGVEGMVVLRG